jgi:type II secretory pathway component PulC
MKTMFRSLITLFLLFSATSAMANEANGARSDSTARVVPAFSERRIIGLRIFNITPDSPLAIFGLENGDLIVKANDQPVRSPDDVLTVYNELKNTRSLRLEIERHGKRLTLPRH